MPSSCALLGGFAIGARVSLLRQHSPNATCQRVLVLALCLVVFLVLCGRLRCQLSGASKYSLSYCDRELECWKLMCQFPTRWLSDLVSFDRDKLNLRSFTNLYISRVRTFMTSFLASLLCFFSGETSKTVSYPVYTIEPAVKPVAQPVSQPVVSCKRGIT